MRKTQTNSRDACKYFVETSSKDGGKANGTSEPKDKGVALLVRLELYQVSTRGSHSASSFQTFHSKP